MDYITQRPGVCSFLVAARRTRPPAGWPRPLPDIRTDAEVMKVGWTWTPQCGDHQRTSRTVAKARPQYGVYSGAISGSRVKNPSNMRYGNASALWQDRERVGLT